MVHVIFSQLESLMENLETLIGLLPVKNMKTFTVINSHVEKELEEPKIRHRNELIAKANNTKAERDRQSNKFPDLSPSIENHIDLSQSSEDERPDNVLHDSVILSSGVTPPKKIKKKRQRAVLENDTRYEVVKFIHDFFHWAIHVRKQTERFDYDLWIGTPLNKFDLARTALCEIDPAGISHFIDQTTLNDWKMLDLIGNNNSSQVLEQNIWRLLINKSQYSSTTTAIDAIKEIRLGSSKDPAECFDRYLRGVISVLK
ncbi:hypothetical protein GEMRC1_013159 [Eukaryota sp. GEM-RC1]